MNIKRTFLATLIASTLVLVGCNEKNTEQKAASKVEQNTTQAEVQKQNTAEISKQEEVLTQFNKSIKILPTNRVIGKDDKGNDLIAFSYTVDNLSDKEIKELHWFSVLSVGSEIINFDSIPAKFKNPLKGKSSETVTLTKAFTNYPENIKKLLLDPEAKLEYKTIAGKIVFTDNSSIVVTTIEDIQNAFSSQEK